MSQKEKYLVVKRKILMFGDIRYMVQVKIISQIIYGGHNGLPGR